MLATAIASVFIGFQVVCLRVDLSDLDNFCLFLRAIFIAMAGPVSWRRPVIILLIFLLYRDQSLPQVELLVLPARRLRLQVVFIDATSCAVDSPILLTGVPFGTDFVVCAAGWTTSLTHL